MALRFVGLLAGSLAGSLCGSTGILSADYALRMILAGAHCVQAVSLFYRQNVDAVSTVLEEIKGWMQKQGYADIEAFRGKLSQEKSPDTWTYTRAQYVKLLLNPEKLMK
jgi:dihydroorotate dehydrogenase (fumarate)